jgi:hypothetical protein
MVDPKEPNPAESETSEETSGNVSSSLTTATFVLNVCNGPRCMMDQSGLENRGKKGIVYKLTSYGELNANVDQCPRCQKMHDFKTHDLLVLGVAIRPGFVRLSPGVDENICVSVRRCFAMHTS